MAHPHPPRALVVDDNQLNLDLVAFLLDSDGFAVACARDADQFEAELARQRPDVILMDIQLPGTDGLELTRRVKADPATASIPVIAVTAYAMKGDEQRIRQAGCDDYIGKPIDLGSFVAKVRSHLREG